MNYSEWVSPIPDGLFPFDTTKDNMAIDAWNTIQDDPVTITLFRDAAQITVRIAFDNGLEPTVTGPTAMQAVRLLILVGVEGHPNPAIPDTNIRSGDRFVYYGNVEFEVMTIVRFKGLLQARCTSRT